MPAEIRVRWYEQLLDELPIATMLKDRDGRYRYVNQRFIDSFPADVDRDEVIGRTDADFLPAEQAADYAHKDRQVIAGHGFRSVLEEITRGDGNVEFYETTKLPVENADGEIDGLLVFSSEVTEPVLAAQAHSLSERRSRLAVQASRDGVWDLDLLTHDLDLSARASRLLHLDVSNQPIRAAGVFEPVDEHARADFRRQLDAIRAGTNETLSIRCAVRLIDGALRTLQIDAAALVQNGVVTRLIGTLADITDEVENERQLRHNAEHDDLTGLANRRALLARLTKLIDESTQRHFLLYIDIDDFQMVNESFGHTVGNELLIEVANRLRDVAGPEDLVARVGDDEFALLLSVPRFVAATGAATIGAEIRRSLQVPVELADVTLWASASIGVVDLHAYRTSEEVMRDADIAVHSAKAAEGAVRVFEEHMRTVAVHRQQLNSSLRRAVRAHEFELAYQPLVDASTRQVGSVEALLRWNPNGSPISPAEFLPQLERTGLIIDLGEWIIDEACRQLAAWRHNGLRGLTMAINLSRVQVGQQDLAAIAERCTRQHDLSPGDLTFEITETAISADTAQLVEVLGQLRVLGCKVAIDDFGVGQSCLSELHSLPADVLKIDQSFVRRIERADEHDDPVLDMIMQLARSYGMSTVAEGVETDEQADWLTVRGCDVLQGYNFARPMRPGAIDSMIVDQRIDLHASVG